MGAKPRIGQDLITGLNNDQALETVGEILQYYKTEAQRGERLGMLIERLGLDPLRRTIWLGRL